MRCAYLFIICWGISFAVDAAQTLTLPRFASLRSDYVNARVGPGETYPIEWVYTRHRLPLKILKEYDTWRLVEDQDGHKSWIHKRMLSSMRSVAFVSVTPVKLYRYAEKKSHVIARIEKGSVALLDKQKGDWVRIKIDTRVGWVTQDALWGIKFE